MKKLFRIATLVVAVALVSVSCELAELDYENPNQVTPDQANLNDLYNSVQLEFVEFYEDYWNEPAEMARMISATGGFTYFNNDGPESFNNGWTTAYAEFLPDVRSTIENATARNLPIHSGSAKVMEAMVIMSLVDMFGDVPYSEALQGIEVIAPTADNGADVYAAAETLLDEAIAELEGAGGAAAPTNDLFYGGDAASWATLAKTLKLRNAVTTRLIDPASALSTINALVSEGDLIDEEGEDFAFPYGNNQLNPNSRHPFYNDAYEASDGAYMSNYYMWLLRADKEDAEGNAIVDPRIRFYFYRQTDGPTDNVNDYSCFYSEFPDQDFKPDHYIAVDPDLPYCLASDDGYWGRDHLNNEGIPPDGFLRTVYGLYPAGGRFDENSFERTQNNGVDGALGEGIQPFMLASFVDFLRAEAALTLGTNDDARALLESGIRKSMDKVLGFADKVDLSVVVGEDLDGNEITAEQAFLPTEDDVQEYIDFVLAEYDAADDDGKLDIVVKEYYIALWGNGLEAYNLYRRTGKPNNMAPALEASPGEFIRSHFYPANYVNLNSNATQKNNLTERVFWDDGSVDLY